MAQMATAGVPHSKKVTIDKAISVEPVTVEIVRVFNLRLLMRVIGGDYVMGRLQMGVHRILPAGRYDCTGRDLRGEGL
jgi:hypothetical protein